MEPIVLELEYPNDFVGVSRFYKEIKAKFGEDIEYVHTALNQEYCVCTLNALLFEVKPKTILEIGTHQGISTAFLAHHAFVITIDIADYPIKLDIWRELGVLKNITHFTVSGNKAKQEVVDGLDFDLAFVDGDHSYDGVAFDFGITERCGSVLFHDYGWNRVSGLPYDNFPDVTRFVDSLPQKEVIQAPPFALWRKANGRNP